MPNCMAVNYAGVKCGYGEEALPYFLYHDGMQRLTTLKFLCNNHANQILGELMQQELGYTNLINALRKKVDNLTKTIKSEASTKNAGREKEKTILWERIKRINEIRNTVRNKTCRFCQFPLTEPDSKEDQLGKRFSHANFHSDVGKRRADILFHTECGITWITNKIYMEKKDLKYLSPLRTKQHTLFSHDKPSL